MYDVNLSFSVEEFVDVFRNPDPLGVGVLVLAVFLYVFLKFFKPEGLDEHCRFRKKCKYYNRYHSICGNDYAGVYKCGCGVARELLKRNAWKGYLYNEYNEKGYGKKEVK